MKNINLYLLLVLALAAPAFTSCDDDEEGMLPQVCRMTAAEFARVVDGKGENKPWTTADEAPFRSQEELYKHYKEVNR